MLKNRHRRERKMRSNFQRVMHFLFRNMRSVNGELCLKKKIYLESWNIYENVGDYLAKVIFDYMLNYYKLNNDIATSHRYHLMTVGSIIGMKDFDSVIWGSGIHKEESAQRIVNARKYCKYDIRAVRGPITATILRIAGYNCSCIYGDPAILMPLIYNPTMKKKKYNISVIQHYSQANKPKREGLNYINTATTDYKNFIDEIVLSEMVISSSLHGIILSETYGIPAILLCDGMQEEIMKFFDWYYSTGRYDVIIAKTIDEALSMSPMCLPDLKKQQQELLESFPVDLWDEARPRDRKEYKC